MSGRSLTKPSLSIAARIYKEKIRDDYTPTLPLSLSLSATLPLSLYHCLSFYLPLSPSLSPFLPSLWPWRQDRAHAREKGDTLNPGMLVQHSETVDVHLCIFNSSGGDRSSAVGMRARLCSGESPHTSSVCSFTFIHPFFNGWVYENQMVQMWLILQDPGFVGCTPSVGEPLVWICLCVRCFLGFFGGFFGKTCPKHFPSPTVWSFFKWPLETVMELYLCTTSLINISIFSLALNNFPLVFLGIKVTFLFCLVKETTISSSVWNGDNHVHFPRKTLRHCSRNPTRCVIYLCGKTCCLPASFPRTLLVLTQRRHHAWGQRRHRGGLVWGLVSDPSVSKRPPERDSGHLAVGPLHLSDGSPPGHRQTGAHRHESGGGLVGVTGVKSKCRQRREREIESEEKGGNGGESTWPRTCFSTCQHFLVSNRMKAWDWPPFSLTCYANGIRKLNLSHITHTHTYWHCMAESDWCQLLGHV